MSELTPVQEFYKGRTVFITGASGFMGKVLIEKLLYSCSDLKQIIILMRPKKGKAPETRLDEMFRLPMFQRIKDEKPEVIKKVILYQGDVTFDELGLTEEVTKYITDNTSIVFHMAATLKLEGNLKDAINMNTTGTKRALDLARKMKNLVAFIHLSTAFCNCDVEVMYEKVYEFEHKPEDLMRMAEWMDAKTLEGITMDLLKPHPNTYTYSKRLAEILVRDQYPNMPVVITRPSIVSPSAYEPVPGWVDNLNGPTGLMVGAGKGVIRSMLIDIRNKSEVIPVDYAISGLISIAYQFAVSTEKPLSVPVYNITVAEHRKKCWGELIEKGKQIGYQYPLSICLWYPDGIITTNRLYHRINVILFMWLPAIFIDLILLLLGQKRFMIHVQKRISIGLEYLQFFSMRDWIFRSPNFDAVWKNLSEKDKLIFNMDMDPKETEEEYMLSCCLGGRLYLLKETLDDLPKSKQLLRIMLRVQEKISVGLEVLQFFTMHKWSFKSERYENVWNNLTEGDKKNFNMNMDHDMPEEQYMINSCIGGRLYLMKEKLEDLPKARRHLMLQYILDCVVKTFFVVLVVHYIMRAFGSSITALIY